jgi:hypothetical protein
VAIEHYFSTKKARERFGYRPIVPPQVAMDRVIKHHIALGSYLSHACLQHNRTDRMGPASGDKRVVGKGGARRAFGVMAVILIVASVVIALAVRR